MGLDSIELLMEVEKTFGINIPDKEAEKIRTVGDFYEVVWHHLYDRHSNKCTSQVLFYKLRKAFNEQFAVDRNSVYPDSSPNDYFPKKDRRKAYGQFEKETALELPSLHFPEPWNSRWNMLATSLLIGGLTVEILLIIFWHYSWWILTWTLFTVFIIVLVSKCLNPFRIEIHQSTMREFSSEIMALNYNKLTETTGINRKEMEDVMNHIIVNKIGVELSEIAHDKSLTDDLGVN
jgi:acyl carrier protein